MKSKVTVKTTTVTTVETTSTEPSKEELPEGPYGVGPSLTDPVPPVVMPDHVGPYGLGVPFGQ